jgi:hypothetical protein
VNRNSISYPGLFTPNCYALIFGNCILSIDRPNGCIGFEPSVFETVGRSIARILNDRRIQEQGVQIISREVSFGYHYSLIP